MGRAWRQYYQDTTNGHTALALGGYKRVLGLEQLGPKTVSPLSQCLCIGAGSLTQGFGSIGRGCELVAELQRAQEVTRLEPAARRTELMPPDLLGDPCQLYRQW